MKYSLAFFDRLACERGEKKQCVELIAALVAFSEKSRRMGLLALEDDLDSLDDPFLRKGLQLIVDGTDPEMVRDVLTTRMFTSGLAGIGLLLTVIKMEAIMGIQAGDNPRIIADKLSAFLGADADLWDDYWELAMKDHEAGSYETAEGFSAELPYPGDDGPVPNHAVGLDEPQVNVVVNGVDFEKLREFRDIHIQKVLRETDTQDLAIALKGSSKELQGAFSRNMSPRAWSLLREDMDFMGPVRREDVECRQEKILNIVIWLVECGDIIIPDGSDFIE